MIYQFKNGNSVEKEIKFKKDGLLNPEIDETFHHRKSSDLEEFYSKVTLKI